MQAIGAFAKQVGDAWLLDHVCPDVKGSPDPWGHPYISVCDDSELVIISNGPDGLHRTGDDVRATVNTPTPSAVEVTAGELFEAYMANEIGADEKYRGKELLVTGYVARVARDDKDRPFVVFMVLEAPQGELRAGFGSTDGLGQLKPDQTIVARCRGGSVNHQPTLSACVFERVVPDDDE